MVNFFTVQVQNLRNSLSGNWALRSSSSLSTLSSYQMCPSAGLSKHTRLVRVLCVRACNLIFQWWGKWKLSIPGVQPGLFPPLSLFWAPKKACNAPWEVHTWRQGQSNGELAIVHHGTFVSVLRPLCGLTRTNWSHNNGWIMDVNKSFCS